MLEWVLYQGVKNSDYQLAKFMVLLIVANKLSVRKNTLMPNQVANHYHEKYSNE